MHHPPDTVDQLLTAWRATRPDLDPSALGLVGRVLILAGFLERRVESALAAHRLTLGQFDILATLRRHSPKGGLTPTLLLQSVVLSSGGMTSRLDKLEASGLVERKPDPADRRGVVVNLTAKGKKVIDAATATRFREATEALPELPPGELDHLTNLLRGWLSRLAVQEPERPAAESEV